MDPTLAARALSAATEITSTALSGDDPGAVLDTVVARAAELADADLGLAMVSADDGRVVVEAAHYATAHPADDDGVQPRTGEPVSKVSPAEPAGESLRGLALPADSAAGHVARGGEPVASDDFTVDPRTAPYVPAELHGYGPFAAAPFGSGGRVLGALTVYRKRGREPFSAGTVEMLVAFAAQAGVVLALAEGANARHRVALYEERERIARELHDVIVQRLYGAGMQLDRVRRNMRKRFAQADGARLSDAIDQLDQTIEEIRGTVRALRSPEPRHDTGTPTDLAESARGEVRIAGELLGYPPTLELSGEFADIPAERADHIRAALREALSNVVRHSGASETRVTLARDSDGVKLRVRDNGSGVPQGVATRGLRHLAERADAAGGKFFLNSSPSLGTLVAFDLPLD
ncbi:GAF domain-containing sensor histidine kinase [Amycolatopsis sp. SID8362]|uniref:GAF domain-containing sensor histidine kinase n=1 Tax=Amycolatopsis sp. SID8362 TaxID=2690346 RepID=UPI00136FC228|nr:GAF domain-containing sensor histidine kinase [Amycolatopsis sp. SID8362]NBH08787.1 GAF domain-containing protein [Amycolatopsis sp. SID8362]NED45480.1 GAF domain-containing protein [Amycolatopsis sp. SID8362]